MIMHLVDFIVIEILNRTLSIDFEDAQLEVELMMIIDTLEMSKLPDINNPCALCFFCEWLNLKNSNAKVDVVWVERR